MEKEVSITLRVDYNLGELLLDVEGEVENETEITVLLGYMATLIKSAEQHGAKWVQSTKLREFRRNQASYTCAFPDMEAKERFYDSLIKEGDKKIIP